MSMIPLFENRTGNINLGLDIKQLLLQSYHSHTNDFEDKKIAHWHPQKASPAKGKKILSATQREEFRDPEEALSGSFWTEALTQCKTSDNLYNLCKAQDCPYRGIINAHFTGVLWGAVSYSLQNIVAPW